MRVINKTKGLIISHECSLAGSLSSRMRGLILSDKKDLVLASPREDIRSSSIHMAFMQYPIDVLWLDSNMRVVDLRRNIQPLNPLIKDTWRVYKPREPAKYVVELGKENIIETDIGDEIEFR
ncbi:MAG: hypothetical protein B6U72_03335 [Candidatus Altiarchaeales archaeon ex4484_2]|nr:MAG: hypothetical protein B6U72_03335 [Candidatus Altiarchaeales archaeon ex4484_2]